MERLKAVQKYTTSKGAGWQHICLVHGFHDKIQAMQFEWAVKHEAPRHVGGPIARIEKMMRVMEKERWTSKAPLSSDVPLEVEYMGVYAKKDSLP